MINHSCFNVIFFSISLSCDDNDYGTTYSYHYSLSQCMLYMHCTSKKFTVNHVWIGKSHSKSYLNHFWLIFSGKEISLKALPECNVSLYVTNSFPFSCRGWCSEVVVIEDLSSIAFSTG